MYSSPERAFKRNGKKIPGGANSTIKRWEQIYTTEEAEGFYLHNHGGYRPENNLYQKVNKQELIEEKRQLECLKKLDTLVRQREQFKEKKLMFISALPPF